MSMCVFVHKPNILIETYLKKKKKKKTFTKAWLYVEEMAFVYSRYNLTVHILII